MGENRDMHVGMVVHTVQQILLENDDGMDLGKLEVGTWVNDKDGSFNITLARESRGYLKRIAIPFELVPTVCAEMLHHLVNMSERLEALREGGA
jgi:hypothetical protein